MLVSGRMYYSGGSWHKPQNSHAALLDKYWTKLQMGNMTREELKKVSVEMTCGIFKPWLCFKILFLLFDVIEKDFLKLL